MNVFKLLTGAALAALSIASAAPIVPCVSGSYTSYQALTMGCSVNDQQFSGFQILPAAAGSTAILPGLITVSPITMVLGPGLLFTVNASASNAQSLEVNLGFNVNPLAMGNAIGGSTLTQNGATAVLDGGVAGTETICLGAAIAGDGSCPGTPASRNLATFALDGITPQDTDSLNFAAQNLVGLTGDYTVTAGSVGSAALTSFAIQVNEIQASGVPEPATLALLGPAGIALLFLRRKKIINIFGKGGI